MRVIRTLMLCAVLSVVFVPGVTQAAEPAGDVVALEVTASQVDEHAAGPEVDCSGFAPDEATCLGTFTVPDVDRFGIRIAAGPGGYTGTIEVQAQASTGFTTIVCDVAVVGHCHYQQVGFYAVGQTVTLVGVASGFGSWIIQAPVEVQEEAA